MGFFSGKQRIIKYSKKNYNAFHTCSILRNFLQQYFHPYQFYISTKNPFIKETSSLLFDVKKEKSDYKIEPKFDPAIKLVSEIIGKEPDLRFKIYHSEFNDKNLCIYSPTTFVPTHFSLRIRDEMEDQGLFTLTDPFLLDNNQKSKIIEYPFGFNLERLLFDFIEETCFINSESFRPTIEWLRAENQQRLKEIENIILCWNNLTEKNQKIILETFYDHYYFNRYKVNLGFEVLDRHYCASDNLKIDDSDNTNKAVKLIQSSKFRHSLLKRIRPAAIATGGLNVNTFCPGIHFLTKLGFDVDIGYSVSVRDSKSIFPANGFIPYWMIVHLYEACNALEIETGPLFMPDVMHEALDRNRHLTHQHRWE